MAKPKRDQSRRLLPWGADWETMTPTQRFLTERYETEYKDRHPDLKESGESELINSVLPLTCPYCSSDSFSRFGLTTNGVQRYRCKSCGKTFTPITGTIFDKHKISISEWMEYFLNIFRYLSINADSWNNRNAFSTSRYWLEKLFIVLEGYNSDIVLDGRVWFDETYYTVRSNDIELNRDGTKLRGLSRNQICIGVACTKKWILCEIEGQGQPTAKKTYQAFKDHIAPGSSLVHDDSKAHSLLIEHLKLKDECYLSSDLKKLPDKNNPLKRVNEVHARLKNFLYAHNSFDRNKLQGYLNLFSFAMNPPAEHIQKVELLLNMALKTHRLLRYRDFYK